MAFNTRNASSIRYSVVPDSLTNGLLIPIPKKSDCDTSVPKNWRPIIISTTLSKLMELYILEESPDYIFSDSQFGFVYRFVYRDCYSPGESPMPMLEGAQSIHVRLMQRVHLMRYHIMFYSRRHLKYCLIVVDTLWLTGIRN